MDLFLPNVAGSLCEEFSDCVLYDHINNSILVNLEDKYFGIVFRELKKLRYKMIFSTRIQKSNSITCTFIKV